MSRIKTREYAMTKLFEMEIQGRLVYNDKITLEISEKIGDPAEYEYAADVIKQYVDHQDKIDDLIKAHSQKWDITRFSKVDLSIIRLALAEILYIDTIHESVSINEAVNLSKRFSDDDAYKFVNGILGNILRSMT
jgi:N utilization substance protein B